jgi:hypothetical protein
MEGRNASKSNLKQLGISTVQKGLNAILGGVLQTSTRS